MKLKAVFLILISLLVGFICSKTGFTSNQSTAAAVFCMSILGVLFFWELRLSFVFFGAGVVLLTRAVDLENFIRFASLDVILFLIGMMILVGMLNDVGFFYWIITRLIRIKNLTGTKLFLLLMSISAILSGLMGEVASIVIMAKVIMDICDLVDTDPAPMILASVLATNIGSTGTVLGNPIGILIAARAGLTFEDFMRQALPITVLVFVITLVILLLWFKRSIRQLSRQLIPIKDNIFFMRLITIPTDLKTRVSIGIFGLMLVCIIMHRRLELFFGLKENTMLMITPVIFAGAAMLYRRDRVRHYVEKEVEWTSILFFLFLFALAGVIKYSGISDVLAGGMAARFGSSFNFLSGIMVYSSGILSSVLDNTVVVASYIPVVQSLGSLNINLRPLWWAILFGACYGGNITVIGSTANIVAMDILEKKTGVKISFIKWLKIGLLVGIVSMTVAYLCLLIMI